MSLIVCGFDRRLRQKGSVLIFTLFMVIFLAGIALVTGYRVRQHIVLTQRLLGETRAVFIAQGGIASVITAMEKDKAANSVDYLGESWQEAFVRSGRAVGREFSDVAGNPVGQVAVDIRDEKSRVNMNTASRETWQCLLTHFAVSPADVTAQEILAYRQNKLPGQTFDSPYELLRVSSRITRAVLLGEDSNDNGWLDPGEDKNLNGRPDFGLKDLLTTSTDGTVNINAAPEPVLACMPGMTASLARDVVAKREQAPFVKSENGKELSELTGGTYSLVSRWAAVSSDIFSLAVRSQARRSREVKHIRLILDRSQSPARILLWRENQLLP